MKRREPARARPRAPGDAPAARGLLITFEGVEGAGKTTQMGRLARWLRRQGYRVERTAEPDGTRLGRAVRRLLEDPRVRLSPLAEVFLFLAARHQHVSEKLRPWLRRGRVVLCDRYTDATLAYQGYGRGVDLALIRELNRHATGGLQPHLTILLDLDPARGLRRLGRRRDRFERASLAFHRRVRRGYVEIQRADPGRVRVIAADRPPPTVAAEVTAVVREFLRGA